jgi:hypothetical protein
VRERVPVNPRDVERRLTTILSADVAGYPVEVVTD